MKRILIVDDIPVNLRLLRLTLAAAGYEVLEAANGVEALKILSAEKVDAVISDVLMPEMDGLRLCQSIRGSSALSSMPILLYSSTYISPKDKALGLSYGANGYLEKPATPEKIEAALQAAWGLTLPYHAPAPTEDLGELKQYSERLVRKVEEQNAELVKRTADLQANEEKFRQLTDHIREVFYIFEINTGRILYISPAYEAIWGSSCENLYRNPKSWFDAIAPEDQPTMAANMARASATLSAFEAEYRIKRPDGTVRWIRAHSFPIAEPSPRLVGIAEDITERKRLEGQLAQSQKMEAIGRLAGGVAHDFNNLLTAILGYSNLIRERIDPRDPIAAEIDEIRKAGERAASLTRQLLAFSRKQVLQPTRVDVNAVVKEMEKMLRRLIGEDVELIVRFGKGLGSTRVDIGQLEQVILNLAVNARDAMPQGGKLIVETEHVYLESESQGGVPPGHYVVMIVTDTGTGMTDAVKSRLFEPFFTTKEAGRGTGLGLSTVHGIVNQSSGHITVYSELDKGTAFKVYLPRTQEPADKRPPVVVTNGALRGSETVMVVEDESMVRSLVVALLTRQGYRVLEAANGGEGLLLCERHEGTIDLLVSDVVMPQMSGPEFADRLRKVRPGIKALFMSGYSETGVLEQGLMQGSSAFLQKPFSPHVFLSRVREILDAQ